MGNRRLGETARTAGWWWLVAIGLCAAAGCGGEGQSTDPGALVDGPSAGQVPAAGVPNPVPGAAAAAPGSAMGPAAPAAPLPPTGADDGAAGAAAPITGDPGTEAPAPTGPTAPTTPASGPVDGTPGAPMVQIPGVPCGPDSSLVWDLDVTGYGTANHQIGGREVVLHYPCKSEGAHVTFILNLHGTMPDELLKGYQVPYFGAHRHVDSHNLIVVAPKSVVSQWGNGDGGVDKPHLMEVIDWVYSSFSAFQIRSMWVAGHSHGAFYAKDFVCDPALADKVKGVVAQAGGTNNPTCIDRISHIHTMGEMDMGGALPDQTAAAIAHGCSPAISGPHMLGNNRHRYFDGCSGFVHSDYLMLSKGHIDNIDDEVVVSILDEIKSVE